MKKKIISCSDFKKEFYVIFGLIFKAHGHRNIYILFSRRFIDFAAIPLLFTFSIKMPSHVYYDRPRMLNTPIIADLCPFG